MSDAKNLAVLLLDYIGRAGIAGFIEEWSMGYIPFDQLTDAIGSRTPLDIYIEVRIAMGYTQWYKNQSFGTSAWNDVVRETVQLIMEYINWTTAPRKT